MTDHRQEIQSIAPAGIGKSGGGSIPHYRAGGQGAPAPPAIDPNTLDVSPLLPKDTTTVTPKIDGKAIFSTAHDMIAHAKSSVNLEMYTLDGDSGSALHANDSLKSGWNAIAKTGGAEQAQMVNDLVDAAKRGVDVRVILDASKKQGGAINNQQAADYLKAHGVTVLTYPPKSVNIDHVKLLITDDKKALIGGMNWSSHSPANHDADVLVTGAGAEKLRQNVFEPDVAASGGTPKPLSPATQAAIAKDHTVDVFTTAPGVDTIRTAVLGDIQGAKKSVHVEMFCLTDPEVVQSLKDAKQRGVDVRVILDPNEYVINYKAAQSLKADGVPVRWYDTNSATQQKLHAKWSTFDGNTTLIGSANWTGNGLGGPDRSRANHEATIQVNDSAPTAVFDKQFAADWTASLDRPPKRLTSPKSF